MLDVNLPIRPRRLRRLLGAAAAGAVLAGTGIGWAADANASETGFLDGLNAHGILVYDAGAAVNTGWIICDALDSTSSDVVMVAEAFYQATNSDVPDRHTAGVWVVEAISHLCPWHANAGGGQLA